MRSYHEQLQLHALRDLTNRAKSGIITYIAVFIILSLTHDLPALSPEFFFINLIALLLIMVSRIGHYVYVKMHNLVDASLMNQWLVATVLIAALHWGIMTGWIIYDPALSHIEMLALIITPAFALGGACTLSISAEIRTLYPSLMFVPIVVVLGYQGTTEAFAVGILIVLALVYIFSATRATHNDYWEAITNHMVAEERAELMEKLSTTDTLTQLKNRMFFDSEYTQEWKRCSRMKSPLSIIMIDLDFFKIINDTHGHMFGDECLRRVAQAISNEVKRPTDCAARYGGEEFIVILPNTDERGAQIIANRILHQVAQIEIKANNEIVTMTCSIGGATCTPNYKDDKGEFIKQADEALYHAKNSGRARYCSFNDISPDLRA